jgi:ubiquinone/menaquinone biosynthesis C-methylase UbiE
MNSPATRGEQARQFYNAAAATADTFSFMNYGFGPLIPELAQSAEPERYCLQLYRHLLGDAQLGGRKVVEVSCGRGGGAAHLAHVYQPAEYLGIDISEENVRLASARFVGSTNLRFTVGNAEALPLADASCFALVNVEAAHLYDDPAKFFAEAFRVLEPGGTFFHADLAWKDKDPAAVIAAAGFTLQSVEDITRNVVSALDADSERREHIVTQFPPAMQADFRDWSGVKGHRAYNRLASGEWVYRAIRATR